MYTNPRTPWACCTLGGRVRAVCVCVCVCVCVGERVGYWWSCGGDKEKQERLWLIDTPAQC